MFFKKLFSQKESTHSEEMSKMSISLDDPLEEIKKLESLCTNLQDVDDLVKTLNKIGDLYFEIHKVDQAIEKWEISISKVSRPGHAQAQLMKAYNVKRREALANGDDKQAEVYLQKIDDLMALAKNAIRYGDNYY